MNTFNRVVMVILMLVAMVVCTLSLVVPVRVFNAVGQQSDALVDFANRLRPIVRVPFGILFALTADLILFLFIVLEIRRSVPRAIRVEQTTGGEVMMSADSIANRLQYEVDQLPGVLRTKTKVTSKRRGVMVELDVEMAAKFDIPDKGERIVGVARDVVEDAMGLKLARPPRVKLHMVRLPKPPRRKERRPLEPELEPQAREEEVQPGTAGEEDVLGSIEE